MPGVGISGPFRTLQPLQGLGPGGFGWGLRFPAWKSSEHQSSDFSSEVRGLRRVGLRHLGVSGTSQFASWVEAGSRGAFSRRRLGTTLDRLALVLPLEMSLRWGFSFA